LGGFDGVSLDATVEAAMGGLVGEGVDVGAGVFHHSEHAGGGGAWGTSGVRVTAVKGVEIAGLVSGMDGHAGEARLFEVNDAGEGGGHRELWWKREVRRKRREEAEPGTVCVKSPGVASGIVRYAIADEDNDANDDGGLRTGGGL
jgi:hypothetical protein